jgi:hypothetical protein
VQCANCSKSWQARAERPRPPAPEIDEDVLDREFAEEELRQRARAQLRMATEAAALSSRDELEAAEARAGAKASAASFDPATHKRQQLEFFRRQRSNHGKLQVVRVRRAARTTAIVVLVAVLGGIVTLRGQLEQQYPELAGLYAAVGLGVNVLGLEFRDVHTLKSLRGGDEVLSVQGRVASVAGGVVDVPQIIVTLLGAEGRPLYEWSVLLGASQLRPGETLRFETQLIKPPEGAREVKLSFASRQASPGDALPAQIQTTGVAANGQNSAR